MQFHPTHHNPTDDMALQPQAFLPNGDRQIRPTLDRRQAQRVPLQVHVLYTSDQDTGPCDGEGRLRNLSKKGCQIVGSVRLARGSLVTLSLNLNDGQPPLCLPGTTVCWTEGDAFSVKFPPMTTDARQRLQQVVLKFATRREISRAHTAFRII